jgi:2-methylisocitrate lyase-like PEP mutase family enzyme
MNQAERYEKFKALHEQSEPFIMPNAWDGASAVLMKQAGFQSIGSTSLAIAFALGTLDGEHAISREIAIGNAKLISDITDLPVNGDLEDGFGAEPVDCVRTVQASIAAGLAGLGIEDTTSDPDNPIYEFDLAVRRIRSAAEAAKGKILLTGRTDNFLNGRPDLEDTIKRLVAFAEVGADVLYAPGLPDIESIAAVVKAVAPKPVNIVTGPGTGPVPLAELAALGVKRVSLGGILYRRAMTTVAADAKALAAGDIPAAVTPSIATKEIAALISPVRLI